MSVIYEPRGKAREYAELACSVYLRCTHSCLYCYCPEVLHVAREEYFKKPQPRPHFLKELSNDARKLAGDRRPVLLSFVGDAYQPADDEYQLTRQAIEILHAHGLKVTILTKGGSRSTRDFDLLGPGDAYAATLTFTEERTSREWEPKAAPPRERIEALAKANRRDIPTWVSLEPVIEPKQTFELVELTHNFIGLYKVGRLNYHPRAKEIDWPKFTHEIVALFDKLRCKYYLKQDIRQYL